MEPFSFTTPFTCITAGEWRCLWSKKGHNRPFTVQGWHVVEKPHFGIVFFMSAWSHHSQNRFCGILVRLRFVCRICCSLTHTVELLLLLLLIADAAYTATHQYPRHPTAPWHAGVRVDGLLDKCAQYSHYYRRSRPGSNRKGQWTE